MDDAPAPKDLDVVVAWTGRAWSVSQGGEVLSRYGHRSPALEAAMAAARATACDDKICRIMVHEKNGDRTTPRRWRTR